MGLVLEFLNDLTLSVIQNYYDKYIGITKTFFSSHINEYKFIISINSHK